MATPTLTFAVALVPPVHIVSLFLWWGLLYVLLVLGMLGHDMVLNLPLIERRPALLSSHLKCHQKGTHISWGAAVMALRCLQLLFTIDWRTALSYLAFSIHIASLVVSCVLVGSLAKLLLCFSIRSILCPRRWLMFLIGKVISWITNCLGFEVQHNT